ncbi:MAG TPA: hypothetical protein VF529_00410 [Solirubrobacteraceae bacterium]
MSPAAQPPAGSPALRLLAGEGRVVRSRPRVVGRGLYLRARGRTAWTLWPDEASPIQAVDVTAPESARFMRRSFHAPAPGRPLVDAARRLLDPRTWELGRSGALLEPASPGLARRALEHVLGDRLRDAAVILFSPSGSELAKAVCFALEPGASEPAAVVLAMADPRWSARLDHETALVERLRAQVAGAPSVEAALPLPPLGRFEPAGDLAVVARPDPLATLTGDAVAPDRGRAWRWLREFHAATTVRERTWTEEDAERTARAVSEAWTTASPAAERAAHGAVGATLPVCAVHGDFWRGNVAHDDRSLRVFDWEWGRPEGGPLFDVWTYEVSDAQFESHRPHDALVDRLTRALERVRGELAVRGLDPSLAAASLPGTVAELMNRFRRATGHPGAAEPGLVALMAPIDEVLALHGG